MYFPQGIFLQILLLVLSVFKQIESGEVQEKWNLINSLKFA